MNVYTAIIIMNHQTYLPRFIMKMEIKNDIGHVLLLGFL